MMPIGDVIYWAVLVTENLIGISINTFMVAVNFNEWPISRNLNFVDTIITMLGLLNILAQTTLSLGLSLLYMCGGVKCRTNMTHTFSCLRLFLEYTMFWFSTCLSVFYCLKIVAFKRPFLIKLKLRLPTVMRHLLIAGPVVFLIIIAPEMYHLDVFESRVFNNSVVTNLTRNYTLIWFREEWKTYYRGLTTIIGFCLPFALGATTSGLIISSLCRHRRQMKQNCSGFSKHHLELHHKAAKMVLSQLLVYVLFFLVALLLSVQNDPSGTSLLSISGAMLLLLFSSLSSVFLILGNSKLRCALERMFCRAKELTK